MHFQSQPKTRHIRRLSFILLAAVLAFTGCGSDIHNPNPGPSGPETDRPEGATSFVSADARNGQDSPDQEAANAPDADDGGGDRSVEEGDIYRLLDDSHILNLNSFRGLQVINFADVSHPVVEGRLQVSGYPVEMYVVGDRALVLLNSYYGYYGNRFDSDLESFYGGVVLNVDISDRANPTVVSTRQIPGWIQASRLTRGGDQSALYVATGGWAEWTNEDGSTEWESRTVVMSFDVSGGTLQKRTQLNLGGYVTAIQATPDRLVVARNDWNWSESSSQVSVIDISDPAGQMVEGGQVLAEGWINNQFNLDIRGDVLRVVSGSRWGTANTNYLQTFDASDIHNLTIIDEETFGDGQDLYGTIFLEDRAFFVTYRRVDPFHAFAIDAEGDATEMSEFVVSGWNDFFRSVHDDTRLIGIGIDDASGNRTVSVSLYDITDLNNEEPMLSRANIGGSGWSEANWDHRAFSVLENAVSVIAPDDTVETGLILLPFNGYSFDEESRQNRYSSGVQIFTFSRNTLTRRGVMEQNSAVRRTFLAKDDTAANLSDTEITFFDHTNPDAPQQLGRLELAPNFTDFLVFGDYGVRVKIPDYYYGYTNDVATLQVVSMASDPDTATPIAELDIPAHASLTRVGDLLVAVNYRWVDSTTDNNYETTVTIVDLTDPTEPRISAEFVTDELSPYYSYGSYDYGMDSDCFDCGGAMYYGGNATSGIQVIDDGVALLSQTQHQQLLGVEEICSTWIDEWDTCWEQPGGEVEECYYYSGYHSCRSLDGAHPVCEGSFQRCDYSDGEAECTDVDLADLETTTNCWDYDRYRYWNQFTVHTLDLTDPTAPILSDGLAMPEQEEGVSMLTDGSDIWMSHRIPAEVDGDARAYVRYFIKRIDASNPAAPVVAETINVPGQLLAVTDDIIYTRDELWGENIVESAVVRLQLFDGLAYLQARRAFEDQQVANIMLDDAGHVLVSHQLAWTVWYENDSEEEHAQQLTVLDATRDLPVLSQIRVDDWGSLQDATAGRALFQVSGGVLVMNLDDATQPYPQAFFSMRGWPSEISIERDDIVFAAGRYGVYSFDVDAFNLTAP